VNTLCWFICIYTRITCATHPATIISSLMTKPQKSSSSSRMHVMNHNSSAMKQRLHPQSVGEISRHSVLSGDRIRQFETSVCKSPFLSADTAVCSVPVPCEKGSAETTVAEGGRNLVAGLWGRLTSDLQRYRHRLSHYIAVQKNPTIRTPRTSTHLWSRSVKLVPG